MKIYQTINKIPGGIMVVPMLIGCLINTAVPQFYEIGGFTQAVFQSGTSTLVGLFLVFSGATISFKSAGTPLLKGAGLTLIKLLIGIFIGYGLNLAFGPTGVLGITPLAVISALTNSNGAVYTALSKQYGDDTDVGAIAILSLNDGPFFTMIALGTTGMANIPIKSLIATLIPMIIGMILGNLDEDIKQLMENGMTVLIPFTGLSLGAGMNYSSIIGAGVSGILLGALSVAATGAGTFLIYSLFRRKPDPMGMAVGTTGGNAVATPASIALSDSAVEPYVATATSQIAAAVIVSSILAPIFTGMIARKIHRAETINMNKEGGE